MPIINTYYKAPKKYDKTATPGKIIEGQSPSINPIDIRVILPVCNVSMVEI